MSDRKWTVARWSVLMDDDTEHLDIPVYFADRYLWEQVSEQHGWTGPYYEGQFHRVGFLVWHRLQVRGDIAPGYTFDQWITHVVAVEPEDDADLDPTQPGPGPGSPSSSPSLPAAPPITG